MIARPLPRPGPIPFANTTLHTAMAAPGAGWPQHRPSPTRTASRAHKPPHTQDRLPTGRPTSQPSRPMHATFLGHGVLSVRSSASGALYRFDGHGARLPIDPRDALLLGRLTDVHVG